MSTTESLNVVLKLPIENRRELIQKASESIEAEDGFDPEFDLSNDALATLE